MTIKDTLTTERTAALKAGDKATVNVIRQIEAEVGVATKAKGFSGAIDDDLYVRTIAAYVKKMDKARSEFRAAGDRGAEHADQLSYEIDYLSRFLPQQMGEAETRALVHDVIASTGATGANQRGQVIGVVMKSGADLDGALVARLVAEELGA